MQRASLLTVLFFSLISFLSATSINYVGGNWGFWGSSSNWSSGNVPTLNDDVTIDCDCFVIIEDNYSAAARTVEIGEEASLILYDNADLLVSPDSQVDAIVVDGLFSNYGSITIGSADNQLDIGVFILPNGFVNNQGAFEIFNFDQGIYNFGEFQNNGNLLVGQATYGNVQRVGILNLDGSVFINHDINGDLRIAGTNYRGVINHPESTFNNYGLIRIENSVTDMGINNSGDFYNRGYVWFYGADYIGFRNSGELLNDGHIRFFNSGAGVAFKNHFGELTNAASGLISVWGFDYTQGLSIYGNVNSPVNNYGRIDIFTGSAGSDGIYQYFGSVFNNHESGEIEVDTYAPHAFRMRTASFTNHGGEVILNTYGSTKKALKVTDTSTFTNTDCGTLILKDNIDVRNQGQLINDQAWMEFSFSATPAIYSNGYFINAGFVHDVHFALENANFDNKYGVVMHAMQDYLYPGVHYYDPLMVGASANVQISDQFYGSEISNAPLGDYNQQANVMTPDPANFSYEKYFYLDFNLLGCGSRRYGMTTYGTPPTPLTDPGNDRVQQINTELPLDTDQISVFPNPVIDQMNVNLPQQSQTEALQLELRTIDGQVVMSQRLETAGGPVQMNRPAGTPAGTYLLVVSKVEGEPAVKRIVFQ